MKILFLGNNWVAWKILEWLRARNEEIVGLVLHPGERRSYGDEIRISSGVPQDRIFLGSEVGTSKVLRAIGDLKPDIGISVYFGYILSNDFLNLMSKGCINVHPALLPYNRGAHPNVWSIIDDTPAGVSIHYLDEGADTGDIVAQRAVELEPVDTGETLYRKLERAAVELFQ